MRIMKDKPTLAEQISTYAISHFELGIIHCAAGYIEHAEQNFREELILRMKERSEHWFREAGLEGHLNGAYMTWEQIASSEVFGRAFESNSLDNWMNNNVERFIPNTVYVIPVDYANEKSAGEKERTVFYSCLVEYFEGGSGRMTTNSLRYYENNNIYFLFLFLSKEDFSWYMHHQTGRGISNFETIS